jgi:predicted GNAT superfamily acetyltransferase
VSRIDIRRLTTIDELEAVVSVQRSFWQDPTIVVHRNVLISCANNGGSVIGALDQEMVVGFVMGYIGLRHDPSSTIPARDDLKVVSQRMAVLPAYRGQGLGLRLKLAQRDYALGLGIDLITWTFDPLSSRNAHFNLARLGGRVQQYRVNYYGAGSPLGVLGISDRLVVDWWIREEATITKFVAAEAGNPSHPVHDHGNVPIANPAAHQATRLPQPCTNPNTTSGTQTVLVEIPSDYTRIAEQDRELALAWRHHIRDVLQELLARGYQIVDLERRGDGDLLQSFYVLKLYSDPQ